MQNCITLHTPVKQKSALKALNGKRVHGNNSDKSTDFKNLNNSSSNKDKDIVGTEVMEKRVIKPK